MDTEATQPQEAVVEEASAETQAPSLADAYREDAAGQPGEQPVDDEPAEVAPEVESEQADETDLEPIAPPTSWAKDAKDVFAGLPREAQEIIATRERERESFVQSKSREAANTRQTVEREAHGVIQQLMQNHASELAQYAQQLGAEEPDMRLLQSNDPQHQALYWQQEREYRLATAQRQKIAQQLEHARQQHDYATLQQEQMALANEAAELADRLPEWSDPSERAKLEDSLKPIAAELGYSPELFAEARPRDLLALKNAQAWKAKADKWDALNKRKMEPVRAARQLPPTARTGAPLAAKPPSNPLSVLYPDDVRRN